jgi:rhodanese-related sulfurtransferase
MINSIKRFASLVCALFLLFNSLHAFAANTPSLSAERLSAEKQDWFILDVRTAKEYSGGHIPGAQNIALQALTENMSLLQEYQDKPIAVYCRSGYRAGKAARQLEQAGFTKVHLIQGHMKGWQQDGRPVEK